MKKLYASLSSEKSLDRLIETLEDYKLGLAAKTETFVQRVLDSGTNVALHNSGQYAGMIKFETTITESNGEYNGLLIATDGQKIIRGWYTNKELTNYRSYEVSPLLLAEFGSGWLAEVFLNVEGVGQGTMPGQRHAFNENGWYWYDEDGTKIHSIGEAPTHPMYKALLVMQTDIDRIGREVFNG